MGYLVQARYGVGPWIKEAPPIFMSPHRQEKNPSLSLKVANNMSKTFSRGYIMEGMTLALTSFFSVPKGTGDICMVFYTTLSILNNYM